LENLVVIGFLLAFIVFSEIRNYYERKSLLNRIMSKNYDEYADQELRLQKQKHPQKKEVEQFVNL